MNIAEMLQRLTAQRIRLIGVGALALLAALVGSAALLPQWRAYLAARAEVASLGETAGDAMDMHAQLQATRSEVAALRHRLHGDTANLPINQVESFVLGRLQNVSWRHDMLLVAIRPAEVRDVGTFKELLFDVELRGSYFGLNNWLADVGEELGFVVLQRFDIARASSLEREPVVSVRLTLAAYRSAAT